MARLSKRQRSKQLQLFPDFEFELGKKIAFEKDLIKRGMKLAEPKTSSIHEEGQKEAIKE